MHILYNELVFAGTLPVKITERNTNDRIYYRSGRKRKDYADV